MLTQDALSCSGSMIRRERVRSANCIRDAPFTIGRMRENESSPARPCAQSGTAEDGCRESAGCDHPTGTRFQGGFLACDGEVPRGQCATLHQRDAERPDTLCVDTPDSCRRSCASNRGLTTHTGSSQTLCGSYLTPAFRDDPGGGGSVGFEDL